MPDIDLISRIQDKVFFLYLRCPEGITKRREKKKRNINSSPLLVLYHQPGTLSYVCR